MSTLEVFMWSVFLAIYPGAFLLLYLFLKYRNRWLRRKLKNLDLQLGRASRVILKTVPVGHRRYHLVREKVYSSFVRSCDGCVADGAPILCNTLPICIDHDCDYRSGYRTFFVVAADDDN